MKADIHPNYTILVVTCSCGNTFETRSTLKKGEITIDVCSKCHPFYTGQQKIIDTSGRVERFKSRYSMSKLVQPKEKSEKESEK